jgi:hypothetical protein
MEQTAYPFGPVTNLKTLDAKRDQLTTFIKSETFEVNLLRRPPLIYFARNTSQIFGCFISCCIANSDIFLKHHHLHNGYET